MGTDHTHESREEAGRPATDSAPWAASMKDSGDVPAAGGSWQRQGSGEVELVLPAAASSMDSKPADGVTWSCCCHRMRGLQRTDPAKKRTCPGLGLLYTLLSALLFSSGALLVKKVENVHSVEISAIRCFFQILFILPGLIYHKTGFIGPKDQRIFLLLRGFLGSSAMILLYYAIQSMPLADATVITFSSPVLTSIFACICLKERCSIWDLFFTFFTITGVVLIARPPFLFGAQLEGIEGGDYTNHLKGTLAAVASAIGSACALVVLRKMGKSVHFTLSIWYYAVIGLIESITALSIMGEWSLPYCGIDRWLLIFIGMLGLGGQIFLVKALQIEKAGPVAVMRTMDVVFAFMFQFLFLNYSPTWWSVGGALCVVSSTAGIGIRKWCAHLKTVKENEI
ncbi:solute carrier family 35 member G1 [Ambystoma mexicanum]|uniref:solute carrier family 35 member G1 n=1 Tax=Ambystoma mexicanum TaxID=8296 RepID=UPI0037E9B125